MNTVFRTESISAVQDPGEPGEPDASSAYAQMVKRKQNAWKLTPRRADRARGREASAEPAPTQQVGAYEPEPEPDEPPDPAGGSAREMMIQKKQEAWKQPRRRR